MNTYEVYLGNGVVRRVEAAKYSCGEDWVQFRTSKSRIVYQVERFMVEEVITNPEEGHVTTYSEPTPEGI